MPALMSVHFSAWRRVVVVAALLLGLAGCSDDKPVDHSEHTPSEESSSAKE